MARGTFTGGIHPYEGKELSKDKPIKAVLPKGDLVYPLSQHIGAPAKPIVAVGDHVLTGQKIAEAGGFVSANIFATVSGTVKAIEPRRLTTGGMCQSIIVENDEKYEEVEFKPAKPYEEMTVEELQAEILAKMAANGPVTDRMKQDVIENVYRDSLLNWVRSFR